MHSLTGAGCALLGLLAGPAAGQVSFEAGGRFHDRALRPAIQAVMQNDAPEARRLARVVLVEFDKLPSELQMGKVTDLQRLARMYLDRNLVAEADVLLTRGVSVWEAMMATPFSPLGPLYADLAKARRLSGNPTEADILLQRAQAVRGYEPTQSDPDAYPIFVEIAALRRQRGDVEGAETLLRRMIDFADRMKGWEYVPSLISVFDASGEILEQAGRIAEARELQRRAATIRKNYGGQ